MHFGYWLPAFGGWLRTVDDEAMEATWRYASRVDLLLLQFSPQDEEMERFASDVIPLVNGTRRPAPITSSAR